MAARPAVTSVRNALYMWAIQHGVLSDDLIRETLGLTGDAALIPFDNSYADFFRTRKIVKISHARKGTTNKFTLATRLPIARTKREKLVSAFAKLFSEHKYLLEVVVDKPFKVDQNVQNTFNPIYSHNGKIACGSSVGLGNQRNAGTLTALAESSDGRVVGISCNHVTGGCNTASLGTPIVCPGIQDVSPDNHEITVIGVHLSTGQMVQGLPDFIEVSLNSDIAFFEINNSKLLTSMQGSGEGAYDTPCEFAKVVEDMHVKKWGRSTELTKGKISKLVTESESIEYNVVSYYGPASSQAFRGRVYYDELYEVESLGVNPFSAGGDSGSLVVTIEPGKEKVVGILIGGNSQKSYVLPIESALAKQNLSLLNKVNV